MAIRNVLSSLYLTNNGWHFPFDWLVSFTWWARAMAIVLLSFWSYSYLSLFLSLSFFSFFFFSFLWTRKFRNVISAMWCLLKLRQVDWLNFIANKIEKKGPYIAFFLSATSFFTFFTFFFLIFEIKVSYFLLGRLRVITRQHRWSWLQWGVLVFVVVKVYFIIWSLARRKMHVRLIGIFVNLYKLHA